MAPQRHSGTRQANLRDPNETQSEEARGIEFIENSPSIFAETGPVRSARRSDAFGEAVTIYIGLGGDEGR
jgi:hypothetical protein